MLAMDFCFDCTVWYCYLWYGMAHLSPPTLSSLALPAGSLVIILDTLVTCQVGVGVTVLDERWVICMDSRMFVVVEMPTICKKIVIINTKTVTKAHFLYHWGGAC